jgi:hypothetical protein
MGPLLEIDRQLAVLAAGQAGVVTHRQLRELGLSAEAIKVRRRRRGLVDLHRGVYAVGHDRLGVVGRRLAAVWAYGPRAVLSHRSAAAAWNLAGGGSSRIDVTIRARSATRRDGTGPHLTTRGVEQTRLDLLPIATPARTLLDPAGVVAPHRLDAALKQADLLGLFDLAALRAVAAAHPRHRGRRRLVAALDAAARTELSLTLSDLEDRFRALCAAHGLPTPAANARPLGWRVDFLWPSERLVVETDGWTAHHTRAAFEEDRARDRQLVLVGYRVVRFTHRQIVEAPDAVARTIAELLRGFDSRVPQDP